jgi:hypothetical protein
MEEKLKNILKNNIYSAPASLPKEIWNRINRREKKLIQLKLSVFSLTGLFSLIGTLSISKKLLLDFTQTGFYDYLSLIFSSKISYFWKELSYSLIESLPLMSFLMFISVIFIFCISLKYILKQINKGELLLNKTSFNLV